MWKIISVNRLGTDKGKTIPTKSWPLHYNEYNEYNRNHIKLILLLGDNKREKPIVVYVSR